MNWMGGSRRRQKPAHHKTGKLPNCNSPIGRSPRAIQKRPIVANGRRALKGSSDLNFLARPVRAFPVEVEEASPKEDLVSKATPTPTENQLVSRACLESLSRNENQRLTERPRVNSPQTESVLAQELRGASVMNNKYPPYAAHAARPSNEQQPDFFDLIDANSERDPSADFFDMIPKRGVDSFVTSARTYGGGAFMSEPSLNDGKSDTVAKLLRWGDPSFHFCEVSILSLLFDRSALTGSTRRR